MKRYSIWVQEYGADHEVLLCETGSDPQPFVDALKAKKLMVYNGQSNRRSAMAKYTSVRWVDNETGDKS